MSGSSVLATVPRLTTGMHRGTCVHSSKLLVSLSSLPNGITEATAEGESHLTRDLC
jgi:hypothetical protein